jgi:cellobiose phosphorylase
MQTLNTWEFTGDDAAFTLRSPHLTRYLYFPLVNEAGMMSVVTPTLHGDAKTGQNEFLTLPVSVEDLHENRAARNFWAAVEGRAPWSATGNSSWQRAAPASDTVTLGAGLLWHRVTRENASAGLRSDVLSFVPAGPDRVELMQVSLTNVSGAPLTVTPTAAIPIYGRSADNLRDHRHVTSLLHRIRTVAHGVAVRPTLSFDERGHRPNVVTYAVLGADERGVAPVAFFPDLETFVGEGGHLERPAAIFDHAPPVPGRVSPQAARLPASRQWARSASLPSRSGRVSPAPGSSSLPSCPKAATIAHWTRSFAPTAPRISLRTGSTARAPPGKPARPQ